MYVTSDRQQIILPWGEALARIIPHARPMEHQGQRLLVIPNRQVELQAVRGLGIRLPPAILYSYDWLGHKPWEIQRHTAALLTESPRAFCLSQFGTGKTRSVIWAADFLTRASPGSRGDSKSSIGPVLVAAPLSTLTPVWEQELFRINPRARIKILHGSKQQRLDRLAEDADWYIINHHGLSLIQDALIDKGFGIVVIDELAVLRNRRTLWWKAANNIIRQPGVHYAWGLTGSPTPKDPTDAWAQMRLLTPQNTTQTFARFRDLTMRQLSQFRWVKRPGAQDLIHAQMQPAVRYTLEDVAELPPITYRTFSIELEPEAKRAYKSMFEQMRIDIARGETITAANEGILQGKLLQVACGFVYTDTGKTHKIPVTPRLEALQTIIDSIEPDRKFIVFVPYLHALGGVARYLTQNGEAVAVVNGATPLAQRNKIFSAFQDTRAPSGSYGDPSINHIRGIVAHPGCMAHGLTLTAANTIIWYSPVNNYETYEQANARMYRPGQTSKTLVAHLIGTPIEAAVYRRLQDRSNFQGLLLELFHAQK